MSQIYLRYRTGSPSFEGTLRILQELVNERALPGFRRIWVQGTNSGKIRLTFTIFEDGNDYRMEFASFKNFRQYRPEGEIETEIRLLEEMIEILRGGPLNGVIR